MRTNRGFTLIELVITVAIVGLLATAAAPLVELTVKRAKEQELHSALREIRSAIDSYKAAGDLGSIAREADASGYPQSLEALFSGVESTARASGGTIYFLRRLPRNPFFPDSSAAAEETWGLRSYSSPPDHPQPGEDVYDVYPLTDGMALDGTAYRDW